MPSFDSVKDVLLKHLPRPSAGSPVSVGEEGVQVVAPGVSVGDLARFVADLSGSPDFLPAGSPVADLRLETLSLERQPGGGADLAFTVRWDNTALALAGAFPLRVAQIHFSLTRSALKAVAAAQLVIDDYALDVTFELPGQVIEARLDPDALPA